jgi:putative PIN family toxin of toxin-antitoxin system
MTVLIDTNVIIVALSSKSSIHWLFQGLIKGEFELAVSNEILLEYEEQIRFRYDDNLIGEFLRVMREAPNIIFNTPYYKWDLIKADPDDNKFADCAISAVADYLITHDKHFNILKEKEFPAINVINAFEFQKILRKE